MPSIHVFAHVTFVQCELMIAALRLVFIHSIVRHDHPSAALRQDCRIEQADSFN